MGDIGDTSDMVSYALPESHKDVSSHCPIIAQLTFQRLSANRHSSLCISP